MAETSIIGRRAVVACALALPAVARAQSSVGAGEDRLSFEIWRNGARIGTHSVTLRRSAEGITASIVADMVVRIGPIPVFHYRHQATETWSGGQFGRFQARTVSNGKVETVATRRDGGALTILRAGGSTLIAPPEAAPFTHWNRDTLKGPMFNPQTGAMLRETVTRRDGDQVRTADGRTLSATRYTLTGDAAITDWYDAQEAWCGLHGKVADGSFLDYRRV